MSISGVGQTRQVFTTTPTETQNLLNRLQSGPSVSFDNSTFSVGGGQGQNVASQYSLGDPTITQAGAPAGRGLEPISQEVRDELGLDADHLAYQTAGGYVVVFDDVGGDGDGHGQSMQIYGPNGEGGFDQLTEVWGDPHVIEGDGDKWDFTKDGDMMLPDGTLIKMDTNYDPNTGNALSFLDTVTIVNGDDRVEITGIADNDAKTSGIKADGYEWRAQHMAVAAQTEGYTQYYMSFQDEGGIAFHAFRDGREQGVVSGSYLDNDANQYVQRFEGGNPYVVDPSLAGPVGSAAWGNAVRNFALDDMVRSDPGAAEAAGAFLNADHAWTESGMGAGPGGAGSYFDSFGDWSGSLTDLGKQVNLTVAAGATQGGSMNTGAVRGGVGGANAFGGGGSLGLGGTGATASGGGFAGSPAAAGFLAGANLGSRNFDIQNANGESVLAHTAEIASVLNDPSLSVEDKVVLMLMLIMKKLDEDILGQAEYINKTQNQSSLREGVRKGGIASQPGGQSPEAYATGVGDEELIIATQATQAREAELRGQGLTEQADQAAGELAVLQGEADKRGLNTGVNAQQNSPSLDVETTKLERMVKKRANLFEMLKSIVGKYDETAKNMIQQIGR